MVLQVKFPRKQTLRWRLVIEVFRRCSRVTTLRWEEKGVKQDGQRKMLGCYTDSGKAPQDSRVSLSQKGPGLSPLTSARF